MPEFIIQTICQRPTRHCRSYEAPTLEMACRLAVADPEWLKGNKAGDSPDAIFVEAAWSSGETIFPAANLSIPSQFREPTRRKAEHFEVLLGLLKLLAHLSAAPAPDTSFWRQRAEAAIVRAEAILAGAPDPT